MNDVSPVQPATKRRVQSQVRPGRNHWTPELVRQRMQVTALVKRLQDCADGKVRLSPDRLKSIEILLAKSLPNLNTVDVNIDGTATFNVISDRPRSIIEWEAEATDYLVASAGTTEAFARLSAAGNLLRGSEGRGED